MKNQIIPYNPKLKEYARQLRNNSTLSEVHLCQRIKGNCIGKGEYWIPDFVLVTKRQGPKGDIFETIVVDAKRTRNTDFTLNQDAADLLTSWKIKAVKGKLIHGTDLGLEPGNLLTKKGKFIKLFNEGGILKTALKTN